MSPRLLAIPRSRAPSRARSLSIAIAARAIISATTVVRVQPRPSKGITDLFLTLPSCALSTCPGVPAGVSLLPGLNPKVTPLVVNGHAPLSGLSCTTLVRPSGLVSCPALSQIKPHTPLLVVFFRQFPLNFSLARVLSPGPYSISPPRGGCPPHGIGIVYC